MRWRRGRVCGGGGHMMAATFQSIWINSHWALRRRRNTPSPWKRYEHLAEFKAAPVSQSGRRAGRQAVTAEREILKQPVATKGVFSCGGAHRRMRSRCDPAQLPAASKPHRDPAGCVFQCFFFFFFSKGGRRRRVAISSGERRRQAERSTSFIGSSWISWRASPVSQAVTCYRSQDACFGTPELSPREREREREREAPSVPFFFFFLKTSPLSECSQLSREEISSNPSSFDLASCFICKVNSIFYGLQLNWRLWTLLGRRGGKGREGGDCLSRGAILTWGTSSPRTHLTGFTFSLVTGVVAVTHQPRTCTARSKKKKEKKSKSSPKCQGTPSDRSFILLGCVLCCFLLSSLSLSLSLPTGESENLMLPFIQPSSVRCTQERIDLGCEVFLCFIVDSISALGGGLLW